MGVAKPSIPKGTRDFDPDKMVKRKFILNTIESVFIKYGFQPLETPAMENLSVLTGKYGDEGDQLLYKVLNTGDFLKKASDTEWKEGSKALLPKISEKGLRYDLTVPFARYVVMNHGQMTFPFKRYQIQPVWRADRPQKGRYREFYQCDADVVGTDSLICEAENVLMMNEVFHQLGIHDFVIKINNRKILTGVAKYIGEAGNEGPLCVAIDKLDKIGREKVEEELLNSGFDKSAIEKLSFLFDSGNKKNLELVEAMENVLEGVDEAEEGLKEIREIFEYIDAYGLENHHLQFDITLARGLSYYTGAIFEVRALNSQITSSISGGGRYDNLTGVFGLDGVSGVGFSFGVDRIYDVMEDLSLFPDESLNSTDLLIVNFDKTLEKKIVGIAGKIRASGISTEVYPEPVKLKKQMNYANKKGIPYVILAGTEELESGKLTFKDMRLGEQKSMTLKEILTFFKKEV